MSDVPLIRLNDGRQIPQLGFGVFQVDPAETAKTVTMAFEAGYRHIDTAEMYGNEAGVGEAFRSSGLARDEVWITSKLNNGFHAPEAARTAMQGTLDALGLDYVDLFLIHWPLPTVSNFVDTWHAMTEFLRAGQARSIGVSNFTPQHLRRLAAESEVTPAVNQIEVHPYLTNDETRAYGSEHGIVTEAWSPIAQGGVLGDPVVTQIADAVGRTPAQVVLRWHVQRGDVIFPKSSTPERIRENFAIFDFELDPGQMGMLTALDKGEEGRTGPNPDTFDYVPS